MVWHFLRRQFTWNAIHKLFGKERKLLSVCHMNFPNNYRGKMELICIQEPKVSWQKAKWFSRQETVKTFTQLFILIFLKVSYSFNDHNLLHVWPFHSWIPLLQIGISGKKWKQNGKQWRVRWDSSFWSTLFAKVLALSAGLKGKIYSANDSNIFHFMAAHHIFKYIHVLILWSLLLSKNLSFFH